MNTVASQKCGAFPIEGRMEKDTAIEWIDLKDLNPYELNPRDNKDSLTYVVNSIKEFGFQVPIIIDRNNVIVCGHTRYDAAKQLRMTQVPCIRAEDLTDEQVRAFRLADNKVGEFSTWTDLLSMELADLQPSIDMTQFGFDMSGAEEEVAVKEEPDLDEMEIQQFEQHDYIVFVFKSESLWEEAVTRFDLKDVKAGKKIGLGRVLDGKILLDKLKGDIS